MRWYWRVTILLVIAWVAWFAIVLKIDSGLNFRSTNRLVKALVWLYPVPGLTNPLVWPLALTVTMLLAGLILYGIMAHLIRCPDDSATARSRLRRILMVTCVLAAVVAVDWLRGGSWAVTRTTQISLTPTSQPGVETATSMQSVWGVEHLNDRFWLPVQEQSNLYRPPTLTQRMQLPVPHWMFIALLTIPTFFVAVLHRPWPAGCCSTCGYSLTGNTSGVCPECGTAVSLPIGAKSG